MFTKIYIIIICLFLLAGVSYAASNTDEVYLKNHDRLSGTIVSESDTHIVLDNEILGEITIERDSIESIETAVVEKDIIEQIPKESEWKRQISAGYNITSGNTDESQLSASLTANKKTDKDEWTITADGYYSSSDKKMNAQEYSGMMRYAFSLGQRKRWYNFYKVSGEHDRFADIDYRVIPSLGFGYWFSDTEDFKAMAEAALGWEHTDFRGDTEDTDELVLIPRALVEKVIFNGARIREDIYAYPSLTETGQYRLHSETVFTQPIDDKLSIELSIVDDYDSDPPAGTKKNDIKFISSLVYSF